MRDLDRIRERHLIELDRRHVAAAVLGCLAVCAGTFGAGVWTGRHLAPARGATPDGGPAADDDVSAGQSPPARSNEERRELLTRIQPGTHAVDSELTDSSDPPPAADPAQAARMAAQQELRGTRPTRNRQPTAVRQPEGPAPETEPVTVVERDPAHEQEALEGDAGEGSARFTLEVCTVASEKSARIVARQLRDDGYDTHVRPLRSDDGEGRTFRVEVGRFDGREAAAERRRAFEREAGYTAVLVPLSGSGDAGQPSPR